MSHVHSGVDQDDNRTLSENETIEVDAKEDPTIVPAEVPLLILVLILRWW